eukprot:Rhum_TRINITY_DN14752_c2_g2::Rhum_TRINITY_DN14752_c2_g2_i1::g.115531::m.115531/K08582/CAPN15; calpain-15
MGQCASDFDDAAADEVRGTRTRSGPDAKYRRPPCVVTHPDPELNPSAAAAAAAASSAGKVAARKERQRRRAQALVHALGPGRVEFLREKSGAETKVAKHVRSDGACDVVSLYNGNNGVVLEATLLLRGADGSGGSGAIRSLDSSAVAAGGRLTLRVDPGAVKTFVAVDRAAAAKAKAAAKVDAGRAGEGGMSWTLNPPGPEYYTALLQGRRAAVAARLRTMREVLRSCGGGGGDSLRRLAAAGAVFVDEAFPPCEASLGTGGLWEAVDASGWERPEVYLRPLKLRPRLFAASADDGGGAARGVPRRRRHVDQGLLGDCWLLSAAAVLSEIEVGDSGRTYIEALFAPPPAGAGGGAAEMPAGAHAVTLCADGWWAPVVVDDHLPMLRSRPAFARNKQQPEELWAALLEKAFAKRAGGYARIVGGAPGEALADLTGFPVWNFGEDTLREEGMFGHACSWISSGYAVTLGTPGRDISFFNGPLAAVAGRRGKGAKARQKPPALSLYYDKIGLTAGHSYSVVRAAAVTGADGARVRLICLRNPWGDSSAVWRGRWGRDSPCWTPQLREQVGYRQGEDDGGGTFWMAWDDVRKTFDGGSVAFLVPEMREMRFRLRPGHEALRLRLDAPAAAGQAHAARRVQLLLHVRQPDNRRLGRTEGGRLVGIPPYGTVHLSVLVRTRRRGWACVLSETRRGERDCFAQTFVHPEACEECFVCVGTSRECPVASVVVSLHLPQAATGGVTVHAGQWDSGGGGVDVAALSSAALPLCEVPVQARRTHADPVQTTVSAEVLL